MMVIKAFQITSGDVISFDYLFVQQNFESCFVLGWVQLVMILNWQEGHKVSFIFLFKG